MEAVKDCMTCKHHVGKKSIDDIPDECFSCVHHRNTLGYYPNWEPVEDKLEKLEKLEKHFVLSGFDGLGRPLIEPMKQDNVNSPKHYTQGGIETIDYIKAKLGVEGTVAYCIGNVMKYTSRWKDKNGFEDLAKARWYLNYAIDLMDQ